LIVYRVAKGSALSGTTTAVTNQESTVDDVRLTAIRLKASAGSTTDYMTDGSRTQTDDYTSTKPSMVTFASRV
jgi:hypothetical protein